MTFFLLANISRNFKINKDLTNRLNEILKRKNITDRQYSVGVIPDKAPNAFVFTDPIVYVTSGLVKMATDRELEAVLLHEVSHIERKDSTKRILADAAMTYPAVYIFLNLGQAFPVIYLPFIGLIMFILIQHLIIAPYKITIGRMDEIKADQFAAKYGYGQELIDLLKKMEKYYISRSSPKKSIIRKFNEMLDEHPSLEKRVQKILEQKEIIVAVANRSYGRIVNIISKEFNAPELKTKIKQMLFKIKNEEE